MIWGAGQFLQNRNLSVTSEQPPYRSAEQCFSPFFFAKGVWKFGVTFWWNFLSAKFSRLWLSKSEMSQNLAGGKRVCTTTVAPLLSRSVARPRGHRARKAMVYTIFLGKQGNRVHHRSGKKGIHHRGLRPWKRKKKGFHSGGVYFFLPCFRPKTVWKTEIRREKTWAIAFRRFF